MWMPTVGGRFQLSLVKQLFDKLLLNTFREDLICCLYSQLSFILVIFLWWLQENSLCRKTPELRSLTQGTRYRIHQFASFSVLVLFTYWVFLRCLDGCSWYSPYFPKRCLRQGECYRLEINRLKHSLCVRVREAEEGRGKQNTGGKWPPKSLHCSMCSKFFPLRFSHFKKTNAESKWGEDRKDSNQTQRRTESEGDKNGWERRMKSKKGECAEGERSRDRQGDGEWAEIWRRRLKEKWCSVDGWKRKWGDGHLSGVWVSREKVEWRRTSADCQLIEMERSALCASLSPSCWVENSPRHSHCI